jgi:hypothetical protein
MPSLTEIHEKLAAADNVIAAENYELQKEAAEEEAAGRITARGFYDELTKLAAGAMGEPPGMAPEPKADAASGNLGGKTMGKPSIGTGPGAAKALKAPAPLPGRTAKGPSDVDTSKMMMGRSGSRE